MMSKQFKNRIDVCQGLFFFSWFSSLVVRSLRVLNLKCNFKREIIMERVRWSFLNCLTQNSHSNINEGTLIKKYEILNRSNVRE